MTDGARRFLAVTAVLAAGFLAASRTGAEVAQDSLDPGQPDAGVVLDGQGGLDASRQTPVPVSAGSAALSPPAPVSAGSAALSAQAVSGSAAAPAPSPTPDCQGITTVAGNGQSGYQGDHGQAALAQLGSPFAVCLDARGDVYIADRNNNVVREVDPAGLITTVAGNGTAGFSGDKGPAAFAELDAPSGLCVDKAGNLYISDTLNHRVRKVDAAGAITTVAGDGMAAPNGDGAPATSAAFDAPEGLCLDKDGNLYIADEAGNEIRRVDGSGTITTVAGDGTQGYSGDNNPATSAELNAPAGIGVDASGNLYIADTANNVVRKVDLSGDGNIATVVGDGTAGYRGDQGAAASAGLSRPGGVVVDSAGDLYIADTGNHVVRKVDGSGVITSVAGDGTAGSDGDYGPAAYAELSAPEGLALDAAGDLYIADALDNQVRRVACP